MKLTTTIKTHLPLESVRRSLDLLGEVLHIAERKRPGRPGMPDDVRNQIVRLSKSGLTQVAIANQLGLSQATVSGVLRGVSK